MMPVWVRALLVVVRPLLPADFCGQLELNVFMGGIRNVNVKQSFKGDDDERKPLSKLGPSMPGDFDSSRPRAVSDSS